MDYQTDFSIEEFSERRQRLAANLDAGTVALIPGAGAMQSSQMFRQFNDFYYLFREKSMLHTSYENVLQP